LLVTTVSGRITGSRVGSCFRAGGEKGLREHKLARHLLAGCTTSKEVCLRRLMGYRHLPRFRGAIMQELKLGGEEAVLSRCGQ
jgi:hypothetical protein